MTLVDGEYRDSLRPAGDSPAGRTPDLTEEHGQLLRQVAVRAEELMTEVREGRWPAGQERGGPGGEHVEARPGAERQAAQASGGLDGQPGAHRPCLREADTELVASHPKRETVS